MHTLGHAGLRALVVGGLDRGHLFEQAVSLGEVLEASGAMLEAPLEHLPRLQAKQRVIKVVGVTAEQGACEDESAVGTGREAAQRISLSRVAAFQFMHFVRDGVIEETPHVP